MIFEDEIELEPAEERYRHGDNRIMVIMRVGGGCAAAISRPWSGESVVGEVPPETADGFAALGMNPRRRATATVGAMACWIAGLENDDLPQLVADAPFNPFLIGDVLRPMFQAGAVSDELHLAIADSGEGVVLTIAHGEAFKAHVMSLRLDTDRGIAPMPVDWAAA